VAIGPVWLNLAQANNMGGGQTRAEDFLLPLRTGMCGLPPKKIDMKENEKWTSSRIILVVDAFS